MPGHDHSIDRAIDRDHDSNAKAKSHVVMVALCAFVVYGAGVGRSQGVYGPCIPPKFGPVSWLGARVAGFGGPQSPHPGIVHSVQRFADCQC